MARTPEPPNPLALLRGAGTLAGDGFVQISGQAHAFHRAISDLPFRALAAVPGLAAGAAPVRLLHDGITDAVYAAVRGGGMLATAATAAALRAAEPLATAPAAPNAHRDAAVGALAGLFGDHAAVGRNPLLAAAGFYRDGRPLALDADALAAAFPQARRRLVIFVHGLACTELGWRFYTRPADPQTRPYGERLESELGYQALYLRYNSGLHIAGNGRRLARLLTRLCAAWPAPVDELVLIGHSMGGLVIRAAAAQARAARLPWAAAVRAVVCLGSPHRGAPLEQAVDRLSGLLSRTALTRPWGRLLDARSVGIRDLLHGATSDADWREGRSRRWRPAAALPRLEAARYHFIGSSIGLSAEDPLGRFVGDGLVRLPSSLAADLGADTAALFRLHHMRLLNHPAVYERLRAVLA